MAKNRLRDQNRSRNQLSDKERQERWEHESKELAADEARLEEIAERVLSVPAHMVDRAVDQAWESSIVNDIGMNTALSEWMDQLIIYDPSFLRRVLEG
jgi:hypothetical protein